MADELDWTAVELDYRAGVLPISALARKFGTTDSRIKTYAQKYGWERKPLDPFLVQQAHGVASTSPVGPKFSMDSDIKPDEVVKAAVLTATTVLDIHRKDVLRLREVSSKFADTLIDLFAALPEILSYPRGTDMPVHLENHMRTIGILIGDKTPADLLEQLSRTMVRLVTLERQAYGLDVLPLNPNAGQEAGEAVQSEVNKLWKQVQELQQTKSVH
jgi:hypothetical protein